MCGILGYFNTQPSSQRERNMALAMKHIRSRGPDGEHIEYFENGCLGHTRLSIIDLSAKGRQPMSNFEGTLWLTFNGEIYNYKALRKELSAKYKFASNTDSEVLIYGYSEWGIDGLLERIEGMFAFVIYDVKKEKLYGARDHLGKKPFYYSTANSGFGFASNIQALRALIHGIPVQVNDNAVYEFLVKSYIAAPQTIYQEIFTLLPGHFFEYDINKKELYAKAFWEPSLHPTEERSESEWLKLVKEQLIQATEKRLIADVPIGAFLSGGIDSSLVCAIAKKELGYPVQSFTVRFAERAYNEADVAAKIAKHLGLNHHEFKFYEFLPEEIEDVIAAFGQPFGDHSAIPTYHVSNLAAEQVKVVLTGDGGDEGFAGYQTSLALHYAQRFRFILGNPLVKMASQSLPLLRSNKYVQGLTRLNTRRGGQYVVDINGKKGFRHLTEFWKCMDSRAQIQTIDAPEIRDWQAVSGDWVRKGQYVDLRSLLPNDFLVKVDVMTMASGLEARSPLLDKNLMRLAFQIPSEQKLKGRTTKYLLRKLVGEYVPDSISNLPKKGFSLPVDSWIRSNLLYVEARLNTARPFIDRYVDFMKVEQLLIQHKKGMQWGRQLWLLFALSLWYLNNNKHEY